MCTPWRREPSARRRSVNPFRERSPQTQRICKSHVWTHPENTSSFIPWIFPRWPSYWVMVLPVVHHHSPETPQCTDCIFCHSWSTFHACCSSTHWICGPGKKSKFKRGPQSWPMVVGDWTFAYRRGQRVILRLVTCTEGSSSLSLNALSSRSNGWRTNIIVTPGWKIKVSLSTLLSVTSRNGKAYEVTLTYLPKTHHLWWSLDIWSRTPGSRTPF